jgi:hypothetical protein
MQFDETDGQSANAWLSIDESLEPDSKETVERHRQAEKQLSARFWRNEGMQMRESDKQLANAYLSIRHSRVGN